MKATGNKHFQISLDYFRNLVAFYISSNSSKNKETFINNKTIPKNIFEELYIDFPNLFTKIFQTHFNKQFFIGNLYNLAKNNFNSNANILMEQISALELLLNHLTEAEFPNIGILQTTGHLKKEYSSFKYIDLLMSQLQDNLHFIYYKPSIGDKNSFYRSIMASYLFLLIKLNKLNEFYDYLEKNINNDAYDNFSNYDNIIDIIKSSLKIVLVDETISQNRDQIHQFQILNLLYIFIPQFDKAMISYLKILISNFINTNLDNVFNSNGEKLKEFILKISENYESYINNNLLKKEIEPDEIIKAIAPLMLRINISIITFDLKNENGLFFECYESSSKYSGFKYIKNNNLGLFDSTLEILYIPEHYDMIFKNDTLIFSQQFKIEEELLGNLMKFIKNNYFRKYLKCNQGLTDYLSDHNFLGFKHLHGESIENFISLILSNPNINYPENIIKDRFEKYICPKCCLEFTLNDLIQGLSGKYALMLQRYFWNFLK